MPGRRTSRRIQRATGLFLFLFLSLVWPMAAHASWYNPGWHHRKTLTLNGGLVPAAQTNFPVLISLSADAELAANALDSGDDILFTSDNGLTKLDHEIEFFDGVTTGALVAWVRYPHSLPERTRRSTSITATPVPRIRRTWRTSGIRASRGSGTSTRTPTTRLRNFPTSPPTRTMAPPARSRSGTRFPGGSQAVSSSTTPTSATSTFPTVRACSSRAT